MTTRPSAAVESTQKLSREVFGKQLSRRQVKLIKKAEKAGADYVGTIQRERRYRKQDGVLARHRDGFHVRYYRDDQNGKRIRVSSEQPVCGLDATEAAKQYARRQFMKSVNAEGRATIETAQGLLESVTTIGSYFRDQFAPHLELNKRRSTADGYKSLYRQYVEKKVGHVALRDFHTVDAFRLLTSLAKQLNSTSISHVRTLLSALFNHALNRGYVESNPIHDVKLDVRMRRPAGKRVYTVAERNAILNLASLSLSARTFFALCAVQAMRPSEAAAAQWQNLDLKTMLYTITNAAAYGHFSETKTEQSRAVIQIIEPCASLLLALHREQGKPSSGLLFTRKRGTNRGEVINSNVFIRMHLKRRITEENKRRADKGEPLLVWKGVYAGRHLVHNQIWEMTHDVMAVTAVSRNSPVTAFKEYLHKNTASGIDAMRKVEAAALKS